jgi:hypothetical protein
MPPIIQAVQVLVKWKWQEQAIPTNFPGFSHGYVFYADCNAGQDIYIIPSEELVVVRLGVHGINENRFLKEIIEVFKRLI